MVLICILYILLQPAGAPVFAAQAITSIQWQQLTSDKAFSYKNDIETAQTPKEYKPGVLEKIFGAILAFIGSKQGNILVWIIVIGIVTFVIYRVFLHKDSFLFDRNKKIKTNTAPEQEDEKDLTATNWETLLHDAVNKNDLRLAVRYSYMRLLQIMQQRSLIQYRIDKTNAEYYSELNDPSYKQPFRQLSRQYEYTWYGHFALSPTAYNEYKNLFDNMKKQLGE